MLVRQGTVLLGIRTDSPFMGLRHARAARCRRGARSLSPSGTCTSSPHPGVRCAPALGQAHPQALTRSRERETQVPVPWSHCAGSPPCRAALRQGARGSTWPAARPAGSSVGLSLETAAAWGTRARARPTRCAVQVQQRCLSAWGASGVGPALAGAGRGGVPDPGDSRPQAARGHVAEDGPPLQAERAAQGPVLAISHLLYTTRHVPFYESFSAGGGGHVPQAAAPPRAAAWRSAAAPSGPKQRAEPRLKQEAPRGPPRRHSPRGPVLWSVRPPSTPLTSVTPSTVRSTRQDQCHPDAAGGQAAAGVCRVSGKDAGGAPCGSQADASSEGLKARVGWATLQGVSGAPGAP